ncbi:MAG: glycosyltransferase, partial [Bacteroidetes bacterium]|nr:glycosyltransferase [Fibrella sp.]
MPPTVSIIILNYNSSAFTLGCVRSIVARTQPGSYELVVVDNNSDPA